MAHYCDFLDPPPRPQHLGDGGGRELSWEAGLPEHRKRILTCWKAVTYESWGWLPCPTYQRPFPFLLCYLQSASGVLLPLDWGKVEGPWDSVSSMLIVPSIFFLWLGLCCHLSSSPTGTRMCNCWYRLSLSDHQNVPLTDHFRGWVGRISPGGYEGLNSLS